MAAQQLRCGKPSVSPTQSCHVPPLEIQALKSHTMDSIERVVKLEGISPGALQVQTRTNIMLILLRRVATQG